MTAPNTPSFDYVNEPDGNYEVKIYRRLILADKSVYIHLGDFEIQKTGSTVGLINSVSTNRSIVTTRAEVLQQYCGSTPIGNPFNSDGTPYTAIGTLGLTYQDVATEWQGVTDANNPSGGGGTVTAVTPVYSTNRTLQTANTTPVAYTVPTIANSREITVQNLTNADVQITTSQGTQIVGTRGVVTLSNPNNTTVNHNVFTGNITVTFLSSVGGNIGGVAPRVIINQKATI